MHKSSNACLDRHVRELICLGDKGSREESGSDGFPEAVDYLNLHWDSESDDSDSSDE